MEPGSKLGSYVVVSAIGEGGMGKVYKAHDPRLDRHTAIKILPQEVSTDPERVARFEREAKTLAALQHPNVASVYGFEEDGDRRFLIMELVEGRDLSERLEAGPIPLEEAVPLALQLLDGLAAAHERGIVHRDLKPANIKLTPSGELKILDFGLARAYAGDPEAETEILTSPTITAAMTKAGVILGTAAYMSPEQARGEAVDQRADIWAFGVILLEMLSGRRIFAGDTVSDTLAAVLRADIDLDGLPADTPANIRRVLRRCLVRDPRERLRSAADARIELLDDDPPAEEPTKARRSPALPITLAAITAVTLIALAGIIQPFGSEPGAEVPTHLSLALPEGTQFASRDMMPLGSPQPSLAISDDGRLVVAVIEHDGATRLYRRFLDQPEGDIVEDTSGCYDPQISPDGSWISFMQGSALMKIGVRSSRATRLAELPNTFGHTWVSNDEIIVASAEGKELVRVDSEHGDAVPIETQERWHQYFWPSSVPGHRAVLYSSLKDIAASGETGRDQVNMFDLGTNQRTTVGIGGNMPRLSGKGPLLLVRDGQLMAADFDPDNPAAELRPSVALENMLVETWVGHFAVAGNGTVVYAPGEWLLGNELVWDDGGGSVEPLGFPLARFGDYELSPDGSRLAISVGTFAESRIWIYDLERGSRRLLTTDEHGVILTWSPDGERVAYASTSGESWQLRVRTVGSNAPPTVLVESDQQIGAYAWHPADGLFFNMGSDIFRIDPERPDEVDELVATNATDWGPDISPDGRWYAYTSDESGRYEIYARALGSDRSFPVSLDGGEEPVFSDDGTTLYYRFGNRFYAIPILEASADGTRFRAGRPSVVVEGAYANVFGLSYDVGPDGRLLLLRTDGGTERPDHVNVILDWRPGLSD